MDLIPFKKPEIRCSFCRKTEAESKHMIASRNAEYHICDVCIRKADELIKKSNQVESKDAS